MQKDNAVLFGVELRQSRIPEGGSMWFSRDLKIYDGVVDESVTYRKVFTIKIKKMVRAVSE